MFYNVKICGKNKLLDFTYIDDCVGGIIKRLSKNFLESKII